MEEAIQLGPFSLLRTLVVIALIYYGGKFLFRFWLNRKIKAAVREREASVSEQEAQYMRQDKGKVHVQGKSSGSSGTGGEYVDYEEVE